MFFYKWVTDTSITAAQKQICQICQIHAYTSGVSVVVSEVLGGVGIEYSRMVLVPIPDTDFGIGTNDECWRWSDTKYQ